MSNQYSKMFPSLTVCKDKTSDAIFTTILTVHTVDNLILVDLVKVNIVAKGGRGGMKYIFRFFISSSKKSMCGS